MKAELARTFWFVIRFCLLAPFLLILWWQLVPFYAWVLGFLVVPVLRFVMGAPVDAFLVRPGGIFETKTLLVLSSGSQDYPLAIAQLVTNIAPFVTLVLASKNQKWRSRLTLLIVGTATLSFSHFLYIVLAFRFRAAIADSPEIPHVIAQILLTLPFLLWAVGQFSEKLLERKSRILQ